LLIIQLTEESLLFNPKLHHHQHRNPPQDHICLQKHYFIFPNHRHVNTVTYFRQISPSDSTICMYPHKW